MPSMNLANKSWNQPHIISVSDGRLHATTSVYSTWIILASTAYQARISGITVFQTDSFTPGGHSLSTDFTVNCLWNQDTFHSLGRCQKWPMEQWTSIYLYYTSPCNCQLQVYKLS